MEDKIYNGVVIFFSNKKGYGFILREDIDGIKQKDIFVHYSDLSMDGFKSLNKDQKVSFKIGKNKHGIDKATDVVIVK